MRENLGLILGAISVLVALPLLLWVTREPTPPQQDEDPNVYAVKPTVQSDAPSATLAWSANSEPGLAGYKIYYKIDSQSPPYDGTGLTEGNSPIVVSLSKLENPKNPEFTIHNLNKDRTYFFTITAYDNEGRESGFSKGILVKSPETN